MMGVGLYIEESLQEIVGRFHARVREELHFSESALRLAAPILLRDIARAMRSAAPLADPWQRSIVLVLSQPEGGIRGLVREFSLLRRILWETLGTRGHAVPSEERRAVESYLDEALASAAERWANMVRLMMPSPRAPSLERELHPRPPQPPPSLPAPPPIGHDPRRPPPLPKHAKKTTG